MPDAEPTTILTLWTTLVVVAEFSLRLFVVGLLLLRRSAHSSATIAWIAVVLTVPLIGLVGYLLVGEPRLGRRRIRRHGEIVERVAGAVPVGPAAPRVDLKAAPIATLAETVGGLAVRGGNQLELYGDTELFIHALVDAIDRSERHCHLLFYIYLDDDSGRTVAEALRRASRRGVACRLLVDGVGSRPFLRSETCSVLRRDGVHVVEALPATLVRVPFARIDLRNHRKLAVIDGAVGFTGSQNIADAAFAPKARFAPWVDAAVQVSGPAVRDLQRLFVEDWYLDTDESLVEVLAIEPPDHEGGMSVQLVGTGPNSYNEALQQLSSVGFHAAAEEIVLTTPYFVPDIGTATALVTAARRGVRTRLIVPARNDSPLVAAASRSHYAELLEAGVEIHEYTQGLLHAKTITIDREIAMIGSANLDRRSFDLNLEVSLLVYDTDFASQLRFLQTSYLDAAVPVDAARWSRRRWPRRLVENTAGLLGPLL